MVLDSSFAASFNKRAGIPYCTVALVDFILSNSFCTKLEDSSSRTKSCLTLGVKTFGIEQRLKWLHKALAIGVKKPLKPEAVRSSLLEGTDLIFFGNILICNVCHIAFGSCSSAS